LGQNSSDTLVHHTVLLKITNPSSTKTSYLFGTHHAFGKRFFDSLTIANNALSSCDILIKENLNIPGHLAQDIINERETTTKWSNFLNKENLLFINKMFSSSPTNVNKMTPAELYAFLNRYYNQQVCLTKQSSDTTLSLDDYIGAKAEQLNLSLIGLETTEEQIKLINNDIEGMPRKVHKKRLANVIEKIKSKDSTNCEETDWYVNMEIDYQLKQPCRNALILTDRNNNWMKIISESIDSNNCFIAVGLSHLMYECGLIMQLQNLDYIVEPIKVK
jgi:uncharacterized protein YbaP (TraB family)